MKRIQLVAWIQAEAYIVQSVMIRRRYLDMAILAGRITGQTQPEKKNKKTIK
jgi:hypothetical protein